MLRVVNAFGCYSKHQHKQRPVGLFAYRVSGNANTWVFLSNIAVSASCNSHKPGSHHCPQLGSRCQPKNCSSQSTSRCWREVWRIAAGSGQRIRRRTGGLNGSPLLPRDRLTIISADHPILRAVRSFVDFCHRSFGTICAISRDRVYFQKEIELMRVHQAEGCSEQRR